MDVPRTQHVVFVHIVTFNSPPCLTRCIEGLLTQDGFEVGSNLFIHITDNASRKGLLEETFERFGERIAIHRNSKNLGFCAAHNQGIGRFLSASAKYFLVLNPDVYLEHTALDTLCNAFSRNEKIGMSCAKLFRADDSLRPIEPRTIDSAGMYVTPTLRHFDRGSQQPDKGQYDRPAFVFGSTGACLMMSREFIKDMLLCGEKHEDDLASVYPEVPSAKGEGRPQLFDEAFFAYREDADLAWRAQKLGWRCAYAPSAIGYHRRVVIPERRRQLPHELNMMSVRNRFLLQLNNLSLGGYIGVIIPGVLVRNVLVLCGVMFRERTSLPALQQVLKLWRRARERNVLLRQRSRVADRDVARWFRTIPYAEPG